MPSPSTWGLQIDMNDERSTKIMVTGNAGSGKSTLGAELSKKYSIPCHSLDSVVWQSGWKKTPLELKKKKIKELVDQDQWIIEGVSHQVFDAANQIIFLDLPLWRCLANIVKRFVKSPIGTRSQLPGGCPEWIGVWKAIKVAFLYQRVTRPQILSRIGSKGDGVITFRSHKALENFLINV